MVSSSILGCKVGVLSTGTLKMGATGETTIGAEGAVGAGLLRLGANSAGFETAASGL